MVGDTSKSVEVSSYVISTSTSEPTPAGEYTVPRAAVTWPRAENTTVADWAHETVATNASAARIVGFIGFGQNVKCGGTAAQDS